MRLSQTLNSKSLNRGKSDQRKRNLAFFTSARHVNRSHAFQNRTKNKSNDYVIHEKIGSIPAKLVFLKIDIFVGWFFCFCFCFFNVYMKKREGSCSGQTS